MLVTMNALSSVTSPASGLGSAGAAKDYPAAAAAPFSNLLQDAVGSVNALQTEANTAITGLMSGNGADIHQAMIASEKASMAFELSLAVRNKAVQAYQQIMSMQF